MRHSVILGRTDFVAEIKDKFIRNKKRDLNLPALRALANRPDIEQISQVVDCVMRSKDNLSRQLKLYLCHRYSGSKLKQIGTYFSISESGVSQTSRRISEKLKKDKKLEKKLTLLKTG